MAVPVAALLALVGCALAFAALDLLRKLLTHHIRTVPLLFWLAAGSLPVFAIWWWGSGGAGPRDAAYWLPALTSLALNIVANLLYLEAVRRSPLSLTIPFLGLSPVFATLLAVPMLGETPTPLQWGGILLAVIGVLWLSWGGQGDPTPVRLWRALRREPGSSLMCGTALAWACALPFDKLALGHASTPWHGMVITGGVAAGMLATLAVTRRGGLRTDRHGGLLLIAAGCLGGVALGLQLLAMGLTAVGLVETLKRALGSFSAVAFGYLFFHESVTPHKLAAVVILAAGVAVLLL
ncbi:MAG: DMT family transporter [Thermoanaerobaculia bacterium]